VKTAIRLVGEGRLVGMFPEGRINRTKSPILKIRAGAALVAMKAKSPLLPCWIEGAPRGWDVWSGWFTAAHIKVFIGQPMYFSGDEGWPENSSDGVKVESDSHHAHDQFIESAMKESLTLAGYRDCSVDLARKRLNPMRAVSYPTGNQSD
jgi:hypothetical protein